MFRTLSCMLCHGVFMALITLAAEACFAQVPTGTPPFDSFGGGPDIINLGDLNVHLGVPVLHKPGRGTDFTYDLSYDSSVWYPVTSGSTKSWQAVANFGWRGVTEIFTGYVSYAVRSGVCYGDSGPENYTYLDTWVYHDSFGVAHSFPNLTILYGADKWLCSGLSRTGMDAAEDGSGYTISTSATASTIYSPSGKLLYLPLNTTTGAASFTDRNGNQLTTDGSGHFCYTLSSSPAVPLNTNASSHTQADQVGQLSFPFHVQKYMDGRLLLDVQFETALVNTGLSSSSDIVAIQ